MNKKQWQLALLFILLFFLLLITFAPDSVKKILLRGRAYANELNLKIQLQGEYDNIIDPQILANVTVYDQTGIVIEYEDMSLTKQEKNIFKINLNIGYLTFNKPYALYIKPERYLGRLFCSPTLYGANCTTPQVILTAGSTNLDLSQTPFLSGDIDPPDGKITAQDMSKIFHEIGEVTSSSLSADINADKKVEAVDYALALYSLSKNAVDDPITLIFPTTTPSPTIFNITNTQTPTNNQTPTNTPIPPTIIPTISTIPTATLSQIQAGKCNTTINGKIYINYNAGIFGSGTECEQLTNESSYYCVSSAANCNPTSCVNDMINSIKQDLPRYASACSATLTLDEAKTRPTLNCQTVFVPGSCTPQPTPTISCSQGGGQACN